MKPLQNAVAAARGLGRWTTRGFRGICHRLVSAARGLGRWTARGFRGIKSGRALASIAALAVALAVGILISQLWLSDSSDSDAPAASSRTPDAGPQPTSDPSEADDQPPSSVPSTTPNATASAADGDGPTPDGPQAGTAAADDGDGPTAPVPAPTPVFAVLDREPQTYQQALEDAARLSLDITWPSGCMSPLPHPDLLPNAPRAYRSGIHRGVDFRCFARGHSAVAALDGRAAVVVAEYEDPESTNRDQLLEIAAQLEATPPYTLLMLYGNYVVIDHGIIPDVGHVVTIYAHLQEVDSGIRVGETVQAGQRVGEIGNRGTHASANGDFYSDPHLHWELHIDNQFLGAGLSEDETRHVYTTLLAGAS